MKASFSKSFIKSAEKLLPYPHRQLSGVLYISCPIVDDTVLFEYLLPKGEAYTKKTEKNLRQKDK